MHNTKTAKILPGTGAANLEIGMTKVEILVKLSSPLNEQKKPSGVLEMDYGFVKLWIDREEKLQQIGLYQGYQGETTEGVKIGITKDKLLQIYGASLAFNSDHEAYEFLNLPGILFEFSPDSLGVLHVEVIYVV